ncbi:hypothetical protein KBX39_26780, partial [Micromonospora sp. D75]|nr:hypothetical protein [Micromonospora sp. D75]
VKVTEATEGERPGPAGKRFDRKDAEKPDVRTVGTGWTTVVVAKIGDAATGDGAKPGADAPDAQMLAQVLGDLPKVSGDWGSGRLLSGKLFSVLLTDDGRVIAGLVTPERLYQAAKG